MPGGGYEVGWTEGDAVPGTAASVLTSAASSSPDLFELFTSTDLKILRATPNCLALTGFHPFEFINISLYDFIHPDDRPALDKQRHRLMAEHSALEISTTRQAQASLYSLGDKDVMRPAAGMKQPYPNENVRVIRNNDTFDWFNIRFHLGGGLGGALARPETFGQIYVVVSVLLLRDHPVTSPGAPTLFSSPNQFFSSPSAISPLSTSPLPNNAPIRIHTGTSSSPTSTLPAFASIAVRMSSESQPMPLTPLQQSPAGNITFDPSSPGFPTGVAGMRTSLPPNTWPNHLHSPFNFINTSNPCQIHPPPHPFFFASLPVSASPHHTPNFAPKPWRPVTSTSPQRRSAPSSNLATPTTMRQSGPSTGPGTVEGEDLAMRAAKLQQENWRMAAGVSGLSVLSSSHQPHPSQSMEERWPIDPNQPPFDAANAHWASQGQRTEHSPDGPMQKRSW